MSECFVSDFHLALSDTVCHLEKIFDEIKMNIIENQFSFIRYVKHKSFVLSKAGDNQRNL